MKMHLIKVFIKLTLFLPLVETSSEKEKTIWLNLSYNQNFSTKTAKIFLELFISILKAPSGYTKIV